VAVASLHGVVHVVHAHAYCNTANTKKLDTHTFKNKNTFTHTKTHNLVILILEPSGSKQYYYYEDDINKLRCAT
jgi:hypothetical protein